MDLAARATVIKRVAGVQYHPGHVWKVLGAMNWSLQKPERQAKERNADLVDYWKTVRWPELKKRCSQARLDLLPRRNRIHPATLDPPHMAPRGETPVLKSRGNHWTKTSVAAGLGFRWDGQKTRLFARTKPDSFNTESLIAFLKELKRFVEGDPVILVSDRLPAHRSNVMKHFLTEAAGLARNYRRSFFPQSNKIVHLCFGSR